METGSDKLDNVPKVTRQVRRETRINNLLPKSQKCQVRFEGLGAKEPEKCSHVCPRLRTFQQRTDSTGEVCWLHPSPGSVTLGKPYHLSEPQLPSTGRETEGDNPGLASDKGNESNLLSPLDLSTDAWLWVT